MLKITYLSEEDKKKLEKMSREEVGRVALRALIILWCHKLPPTSILVDG